MINYRLVENEYQNGLVKYVVEKQVNNSEWESVFQSVDIEASRAVLNERRAKIVPVKSRILE